VTAVRRLERELERIPDVVLVLPTNGNHLKLILRNGKSVFTSSTPGDWRTMKNLQAQVRRFMREPTMPNHGAR
jgi:hypothetical protein